MEVFTMVMFGSTLTMAEISKVNGVIAMMIRH